jgi:hypothetical protein
MVREGRARLPFESAETQETSPQKKTAMVREGGFEPPKAYAIGS